MKTQEKFIGRLEELADDLKLQLIVDHGYANTGVISFHFHDSFEPLLRFGFHFDGGTGSFGNLHEAIGKNENGGLWTATTGGTFDVVIDKISEYLARNLAGVEGHPLPPAPADGTPDA